MWKSLTDCATVRDGVPADFGIFPDTSRKHLAFSGQGSVTCRVGSQEFRQFCRKMLQQIRYEPVPLVSNSSKNTHFRPFGMSGRGIQTPTRLFIRGSFLSLCVVVFCTGETQFAWATCGDYLHGRATSVDHHVSPGLPVQTDQVFGPSGQPARHTPGPLCSGPQCRRHQEAPATPDKAIQLSTFSDAILPAIVAAVDIENAGVARPTNVDRLTRPDGRIFRPPRAA